MALIDTERAELAVRGDGPGHRDLRWLRRQHDGRCRVVRRHVGRSSAGSATTSSAACSPTTSARAGVRFVTRPATDGTPTGRCLIVVTARRGADAEHLPRRGGRARPRGRRRGAGRAARRSRTSRATSGTSRAPRTRSGPRPRHAHEAGRRVALDALGPLLRRPSPRRLPRPRRARRRHPVRQRGRDLLALRGRRLRRRARSR